MIFLCFSDTGSSIGAICEATKRMNGMRRFVKIDVTGGERDGAKKAKTTAWEKFLALDRTKMM